MVTYMGGQLVRLTTSVCPAILKPNGTLITVPGLQLPEGTTGHVQRFWPNVRPDTGYDLIPGQHIELQIGKAKLWVQRCSIEPDGP